MCLALVGDVFGLGRDEDRGFTRLFSLLYILPCRVLDIDIL